MIQHHKQLSLDLLLPDGLTSADAPGSSAAPGLSENSSSKKHIRARTTRKPRTGNIEMIDLERPDPSSPLPPARFVVDGVPALVSLSHNGLEWSTEVTRPSTSASSPSHVSEYIETVPFIEMLSAQQCEPRSTGLLPCLKVRLHRLEVFTFRRSPTRRCEWAPRRLVLEAPDEETVQDWAAAISRGIEAAAGPRPRSLLVVLNPNSGHRQGRRVYQRITAPVFAAAGIKVSVRETQRQGHASEMVAELSAEQLRRIDGIVCVGGDGVFHEVLNGLLQARGQAAAAATAAPAALASPAAAELSAALSALRLAHIPAGSTDAVACTLHGTRGAFTAAMHVALGDSTPLDVLRVDTASGGTKFASCVAAYGFLGDVTSTAESYRWLGPLRYDLVGAAKLMASRAYPARIRYLEGEVGRALSRHSHSICASECNLCRTASFLHSRRASERQLGAASAASGAVHAAPGGGSSSAHSSPSLSASIAAAAGQRGVAALAPVASCASAASLGSVGATPAAAASEPQSPAAASRTAAAGIGGGPSEPGHQQSSPARQPGLSGRSTPGVCESPHFTLHAASAADRQGGEEWQEIEGEWCSIMLIVMPCRSDKTRSGMARYGHLADGRIKLVLVRKCNPLQYLRFLVNMSRNGCAPGQLPYVTVLDAVAVQVDAGDVAVAGSRVQAPVSCWNLDGELVRGADMRMSAEVHHGLLRVFSRGVEQ